MMIRLLAWFYGKRKPRGIYWTWNEKPIPYSQIVDECAEAVNMIENSTDELKYDQHTCTPAHLHTADSLTDQSVNEEEGI